MIVRIIILLFLLPFLQSCNKEKNELKESKNNLNEVKDFLFVGIVNKKEGIYKYSFGDNKFHQFWFNKNEKVVELSYSENRKNVFFITAKNFGISGVFPFINTVRLYIVNPETGKAVFIEEPGTGLQVSTYWEDENNFRFIINSFDKTNSNYINHRTMLFNCYGRKLNDKTEIFDITVQGYPQLPERKINYTSPGKEYSLEIKSNDSVAVYLKKDNSETFIVKINQQITQIEWAGNRVFFSSASILPDNETLYSESPETSKLFIYDLETEGISESWRGGGIKKFFIFNELLIFDTGFEEKSRIIIYNYLNLKVIDEIKVDGGCGIKNIPGVPDYGA